MTNLLFFPVNPPSGPGTIFEMQQGQFGPGDQFVSIYVLDDEGPVNRTFSNPIVDGVTVQPSVYRGFTAVNCDGWLFPPQPLPQKAVCKD